MSHSEYIERASKVTFPEWATHAAIHMFDDRVEPAAWDERAKEVIGEDPATLKNGDWATSYKRAYWRVIPLTEIPNLKQITKAIP